jgi:hypothetical protein
MIIFPDREKDNRPQFRISERRAVVLRKLNFLFLLRRLFGLRGLRLGEALLEFVHAAGGVHELLLTGVKRMAGVANADDNGGFGGTRLDHVAASATDFRIRIFWMNVRLHKRGGKLPRNGRMTRRNFAHRRFTCDLSQLPSWQMIEVRHDFLFAPTTLKI